MLALDIIVNEMNWYAERVGDPILTRPFGLQDLDKIEEYIEYENEGETLTQDGELSRAQIQRRLVVLDEAQLQLDASR